MKRLVLALLGIFLLASPALAGRSESDYFLTFTDLALSPDRLDNFGQYLGPFWLEDPLGQRPITGQAWAVPVGKAVKITTNLKDRYSTSGTCYADTLPDIYVLCQAKLIGDWGSVTYHWYEGQTASAGANQTFSFTAGKVGTTHHLHLRARDEYSDKTANAYITTHKRLEKTLVQTKLRPGPLCRLSDIIPGPAMVEYAFSQDWANRVAAGASVSTSKLLPVGVEVKGEFDRTWGESRLVTISTPEPIPAGSATIVVTSMDRQEDVYKLYQYAWDGLYRTSKITEVKPAGTPRTCFLFPYRSPEAIQAILKGRAR